MVEWLRICLPKQETRIRSLAREDPTCRGATKPVHHNYWACAPQLLKPTHPRTRVLQLLSLRAATTEACAPRARAPQQEKLAHCNEEQPSLATTRESPCAVMKTQRSQKKKKKKILFTKCKKRWQYLHWPLYTSASPLQACLQMKSVILSGVSLWQCLTFRQLGHMLFLLGYFY